MLTIPSKQGVTVDLTSVLAEFIRTEFGEDPTHFRQEVREFNQLLDPLETTTGPLLSGGTTLSCVSSPQDSLLPDLRCRYIVLNSYVCHWLL